MPNPLAEPLTVAHEHGEVMIDGPQGSTVSLTPEAALRTAGRLDEAALEELLARAGCDPEEALVASRTGRA